MAAPKGNQFWKARASSGARRKYSGPDELRKDCEEYFEWVESNPLYEAKLVSYQGESKIEQIPKMRAMTIGGLCIFLGINHDTWIEWRTNRDDLSEVITDVEQTIREQKFAGAAAEMLNPNIIARDLGLADKQESKHSGGVNVTSTVKYVRPSD